MIQCPVVVRLTCQLHMPQKRLQRDRPYEHPMIIEVISQFFFRGPKAVVHRFKDKFTSSSHDAPEELEVPKPMLALVATAV